jgi:pimeloyl-ACP methyl ester carboxylesterase
MNIFLLRGLVREKEHWGDFKSKVQEAFPDAKIITPEIQGVGQYVDNISPNNFPEMIEFMRSNHNEFFCADQENVLMAMSMGGMITRQWIEMYPTDFKRVILVNTSFKGINPLFNRLKPAGILNFFKIFLSPGVEAREKSIIKMVSNNSQNHPQIIKEWIGIQNLRPVKRASFVNQIKAALTFAPPQTWPGNLPLLILAGKKDRLCSYKSSQKLHQVWGGQYLEHPTAGHDLPIDDGPWLVEKMKRWME